MPGLASRSETTVCLAEPGDLLGLQRELEQVYLDAFGGPPWFEGPSHGARFRQRLGVQVRQSGFRAVVARGDRDGQIQGFGLGFTSVVASPPIPWHGDLLKRLGPECSRRFVLGAFELAELAVRPGAQRQGVGGRLHDLLLRAGASRGSWLLTDPEAPCCSWLLPAPGLV